MKIDNDKEYSATITFTSKGLDDTLQCNVEWSEDPGESEGPYPQSYKVMASLMEVILKHFPRQEVK